MSHDESLGNNSGAIQESPPARLEYEASAVEAQHTALAALCFKYPVAVAAAAAAGVWFGVGEEEDR